MALSERLIKALIMSSGLIFVISFTLIPIVWMVALSLSGNPDLLIKGDFRMTLKNYRDLLTSPELHFTDYIRNSIIVASASASLSLTLCVPLSYYLSRLHRNPTAVLFSVLVLSMLPPISSAIPLYRFFASLGLINTYVPLIITYSVWSIPLGTWLIYSYINSLPRDLDRSALVDGASTIKVLLYIILPLSKPGMLCAFVLMFIFSFNEFLFALLFTIDHGSRTVPVGIALFEGLHGEVPWGYITASSLISVIPILITVVLFQRHIISGLTGGGLKE